MQLGVGELPAGAHKLELDFAGKLNEQPFGLFITRYQDGTEQKSALATQMEATDARRMFPCWDEPVFRATFASRFFCSLLAACHAVYTPSAPPV